jgi:DNA-binding transcriptional LysR family regulator
MCVVTATQYDALEALARYGSIKRAAYGLGVSHAAVEHRLKKVRKRTGLTTHQLMHRLGQGRVSVQDGFWYEAA